MVYGIGMAVFPDPSSPTHRLDHIPRSIALVGMMGVGKSTIGRRLAARLGLPFMDSDVEIERAAGCSISDLFDRIGEDAFRQGEQRVIERLLDGTLKVLATGGGAFARAQTRSVIQDRALTVWLDADLDTLVERTSRRTNRPLLRQGDPRQILSDLKEKRHQAYALADLHIESSEGPHGQVVTAILEALEAEWGRRS